MKYKAIGFDWGGVIKGQPGGAFTQKVSNLLGLSRDDYRKIYFKHNKKSQRGDISWEKMWKIILEELGQPEKLKKVLKISEAINAEKINREVLDLVDLLKNNGYKTGLFSNNSVENAQKMREEGVDRHFDVFHVSAETGHVKPEPSGFDHFASELGVKPSELIFIDDSEMSLSTAYECGYQPILFESLGKLKMRLKELGINLNV